MNALKVILFSALLLLAVVACGDGSATVETLAPPRRRLPARRRLLHLALPPMLCL